MKRHGFIRNKDDIKFLILFSLSYVKISLDLNNIYDICSWCDNGFSYFQFNEAFLELIDSNHIEEHEKNCYQITEKGKLTAKEFQTNLPASIRDMANISALRVVKQIQRNAHIITNTTKLSDVDFDVRMEMEHIFSINFNVATKEQASMLENHFKKNAEKIYDDLLDVLIKEY